MTDRVCSACDLPRRHFLARATSAAAAALAALAMDPREAAAFPLRLGRALSAQGDELSYPIPATDGVTIDRAHEVILVRWKGTAYAFSLSCPHQNTALRWRAGDSQFQCPKHKSRYQPDGTFVSGKATRNMDRFPVRRRGKLLLVNRAQACRNDRQAGLWRSAALRLS